MAYGSKMKCPIAATGLDISKVPKEQITIELKCPIAIRSFDVLQRVQRKYKENKGIESTSKGSVDRDTKWPE